ncbi:MAG: SDR family oxidoreductase [Calditrichia bacterium]
MKILFIGGTGTISSACSRLCIEKGHELHLLNRGKSMRTPPPEARIIHADFRNTGEVKKVLGQQNFDVVVDWIAFSEEHVKNDFELFRDIAAQYVFISSASAYQTPPLKLPVTETTPLSNPYWEYSRNKIACEEFLMKAFQREGFPVTIVRPSHTYDKMSIPFHGGFLLFDRLRKGKKVIIHGDGTSIWTLTHHCDFAKGFVGLLGNASAIGEAYHITSDEWLTWNQIAATLAEKAELDLQTVHLPSDFIARYDAGWGAGLLGDKSHSMIFDNSKIKHAVPDFSADIPFSRGAEEIVSWYFAEQGRQQINPELDSLMDRMINDFESITGHV